MGVGWTEQNVKKIKHTKTSNNNNIIYLKIKNKRKQQTNKTQTIRKM